MHMYVCTMHGTEWSSVIIHCLSHEEELHSDGEELENSRTND